jgi:hypothetical protein
MEELNDFARKQWYENQMIRKRAEERARQAEMDAYGGAAEEPEAPKYEIHRPISDQDNRRNSRDKKTGYEPAKKHSMPQANHS